MASQRQIGANRRNLPAPTRSLSHCCDRPRDRSLCVEFELGSKAAVVQTCTNAPENAVGVQESANNPYRRIGFQTSRRTPYVVLQFADRIYHAPPRTSITERCTGRPRVQSSIDHHVHHVNLTSLNRSFPPIAGEPAVSAVLNTAIWAHSTMLGFLPERGEVCRGRRAQAN
jgi:hypothetical protein